MMQGKFARVVFAADGEGRAGNMVFAADTACQATHKRRLAATKITHEFDNLAAFKLFADFFGELLGIF